MTPQTSLEDFKRDRLVVAIGLVTLVLLAWAYLVWMASDMTAMDAGAMSSMEMPMGDMPMDMVMPVVAAAPRPWGVVDLVFLFLMWAVMQVAMMLPAAAPMVLMFTKLSRERAGASAALARPALFVLGYLLVWTAFSAAAASAQWILHGSALLSPMMATTSPLVAGVILIGTGLYQFTPLKHACLRGCRSPLGFFLSEWRPGGRGALVMGLRHGTICVGCCWLLMAILFVAGVMNLLWIAVIAGYVLIEKIAPRGDLIGRIAGAIVVLWGVWLLAGGV